MKKITRRAALKGTAAVAAASTVPGVANAVQVDPLLDIIRALKEADTASSEAHQAQEEAEQRVGHKNVPHWGIVEVETSQGPRFLGRGEIEQAAMSNGPYAAHITAEQRDKYLAALDERERWGRERYIELGLEPYLKESERLQDRYWTLLRQICETPAKSVEGFAAKVALYCDYEEAAPGPELRLSVAADAEHLAA